MEKAEVITEYDARSSNELSVRIGESVEIIDKKIDSSGLWKVIFYIVQDRQHDCHAGHTIKINILWILFNCLPRLN